MKSLSKMLPALGLVFGATLAMAMNFATPEQTGTLHAFVDDEWVEIPETQLYNCDDEDPQCVARFDENGDMVDGSLETGKYVPIN
ncbi:DUF6520 family protein [Algoriphagus resistens]|uniref:DUF6520 family protein n=1 Tax=Algoriphagus resistens TaxID=1750590 RepID=UPI0007168F31|nr:DUF6520 family protein [Algoriphagus resistens]